MCINTHCTPFKITKYYTTIKVKARVQPLKKLKSQNTLDDYRREIFLRFLLDVKYIRNTTIVIIKSIAMASITFTAMDMA